MTKRTKIGGLSVKCIKNRGFQGQKFLNISSKLSKNPFFAEIVTCLTIKCENEGTLT